MWMRRRKRKTWAGDVESKVATAINRCPTQVKVPKPHTIILFLFRSYLSFLSLPFSFFFFLLSKHTHHTRR